MAGVTSAAAQNIGLEIAAKKRGKTPEQKEVIDFFYDNNQGCGCLNKGGSKLTMSSYLSLVQNKCTALNLREKALQKIGLDESEISEIPPVVLYSFRFDDDCMIKVDAQFAVSSQYSATYIFFSATQMYIYRYIFDTTSDNTWEFTKDFFYTDVTSFGTTHKVKEKIDVSFQKGCFGGGENVSKYHYVVDEMEIVVPGTSYSFSVRNSETVEQSIQAAKAMIREKKYTK